MDTPIWVSKGKKRYVGGTVTETSGVDISAATLTIALGASETVPPDAFGVPDVDTAGATTASRVVKLLVESPQATGTYYCWVNVEDSPEIEPLMVQGPIEVS